MKYKGLLTILISAVFALIIVFSGVSVLTVKYVEADFDAYNYGKHYTEAINEDLKEYKGKNLLFLDTDEVKDTLSKYTYYEVSEVKKSFPNVIKVSLKERLAKYAVTFGEAKYIVSSEGFVLEEVAMSTDLSHLTEISVRSQDGNEFSFAQPVVGQKLSAELSEVLTSFIEISDKNALSDCVYLAEVFANKAIEDKNSVYELALYTKTSVVIVVSDFLTNGVSKTGAALKSYNDEDDYIKANNYIIANETNGEISVVWSQTRPW